MSKRRWVFIILEVILLLLTACSSGGQVMDSEDMVRSYTQISQDEAGEFDFIEETVLLNSGWEMPVIGTGTWTLSDEEAENSTYYALKSGMHLIDTARYYQNAELRDYVKQCGIVMESWYPFGGRGHTQESFENDVILDIANRKVNNTYKKSCFIRQMISLSGEAAELSGR